MIGYRDVKFQRLFAAIIDGIIVSFISSLLIVILTAEPGAFDSIQSTYDYLKRGNYQTTVRIEKINDTIKLVVGILFFVGVPLLYNGQTIGKKLLSIKAVNEYGRNPSFWQHLIRAIQVWAAYAIFLFAFIFSQNLESYSSSQTFLTIMCSILIVISLAMIFVRRDVRGIHDFIAGTFVVRANTKLSKEEILSSLQGS